MSKGSGSTRGSSSSSPRGLRGTGWTIGEDSLGAPAIRAKGESAAKIYYALSSPVERAVESNVNVGDIRTGGGFSGPMDNREFTIIFRNGTTNAQIKSYLDGMKEGAKLYSKMNDRSLSDEEYQKAAEAFDAWYARVSRRSAGF